MYRNTRDITLLVLVAIPLKTEKINERLQKALFEKGFSTFAA